MRSLRFMFVIALAGGLSGTANATIVATGMSTAADHVTLVNQVDFIFGGHKHCWYADGWNGPGWYWCGYSDAKHKGKGYGGPEGYRGWKH
jgi:hypothetical protein